MLCIVRDTTPNPLAAPPFGVPQGYVLGALLFTMPLPLSKIMQNHGIMQVLLN